MNISKLNFYVVFFLLATQVRV